MGISFVDYNKELVPATFNFETCMILVANVTVLVSLVGWSIGVKVRPHRNVSRFILDVILLYVYFQLVYSPLHGFEYFLGIFPWIFGIYALWQVLEYREWKNGEDGKSISLKRFLKTVGYTTGIAIALGLLYYIYESLPSKIHIISKVGEQLQYSSVSMCEWYVLMTVFGLVMGFRLLLWKFR